MAHYSPETTLPLAGKLAAGRSVVGAGVGPVASLGSLVSPVASLVVRQVGGLVRNIVVVVNVVVVNVVLVLVVAHAP